MHPPAFGVLRSRPTRGGRSPRSWDFFVRVTSKPRGITSLPPQTPPNAIEDPNMSQSSSKPNDATDGQLAALLRSLSQKATSELFGVSTAWLKDNAHIVPRNDDGTYDARQVARAIRTVYRSADLPDQTLESALLVVDEFDVGELGSALPAAISNLERIEATYGAAGMAVVGELMLERMRLWWRHYGWTPKPAPTAEEIRAEGEQDIERRISELGTWDAARQLRVVKRCEECGKTRRGPKWGKWETPKTHLEVETICPACQAKD